MPEESASPVEVLDVEGVGRVEVAVEEVEVGRLQARLDVVVPDVAAFGDRQVHNSLHKPIMAKVRIVHKPIRRSEGFICNLFHCGIHV